MRLKNPRLALLSFILLIAVVCASCSFEEKGKESFLIAQGASANQNQSVSQNQRDEPANISQSRREEPAATIWPRPKILSRQEWGAKDATGKMQTHTLQHITIHHTASPQKERVPIEMKMRALQNFSQSQSRLASGKKKPAWPDVPYHYYIAVDGQIAEGREIKYVGDTNTDYDPAGHALIVLEGNFENEQPTSEQLESLGELVAWLSTSYRIPISEVKGHNDYAQTACPGMNLKKALPALLQKITESRTIADK